jgi:hypothetical protein
MAPVSAIPANTETTLASAMGESFDLAFLWSL